MDKRIIKTIPAALHFAPAGAVVYDGLYDYITDEKEDHAGALYVSLKKPKLDAEGKQTSDETVLVEPDVKIKRRHTFAGWNAVGEKVAIT